MVDHVDAVISLCDKIENLDLDETERALLHLVVDIALDQLDAAPPDVEGFAAASEETAGPGLRESLGRLAGASPDSLERRLAFNRSLDRSGYEALPPA